MRFHPRRRGQTAAPTCFPVPIERLGGSRADHRLDLGEAEIAVDAPWEASQSGQWDGQSLKDFFDSRPLVNPQGFKALIPVATRPIFGAEPRELSLLFVLFYIASSGDETHPGTFERNFDTRDGAQMWRFVGGSQRIAERLAKRLGRGVVPGSPARRIEHASRGVHVTSDNVEVVANRAIVALPPEVAGHIDFVPELPPARAALNRGLRQGSLIKAAAVYAVGIAAPGILTAHGPALRAPVGRIHWAGTETSDYWNGYMDGAVRSGERAAREVLDEL